MKAIGHLSDASQQLEGTDIVWFELILGLGLQQVLWSMEDTEPHPIVHHNLKLMMATVIVAHSIHLSLEKMFTNLHEEGIMVA